MLVDGKWSAEWQPVQGVDARGGFVRKDASFRNWVTVDGQPGPTGQGGFKAEAGRYHLYAAFICPWASRVLMARELHGLTDAVSVSIVNPTLTDQGWAFGGAGADHDPIMGARFMHQIYTSADPHYTGRATVPVLWDRKGHTIVSNESSDIVRMLGDAFGGISTNRIDLYPADLRDEIDALGERMYSALNNGVYRAGLATTQLAYEEAAHGVFAMLDDLDERLADGPFLFGERLTESDLRLFVTLVRFDVAYHGAFKLNLRRIADYPNLSRYLARVMAVPGVARTVRIEHIKLGYYSIKALNPLGIVPIGPREEILPHNSADAVRRAA